MSGLSLTSVVNINSEKLLNSLLVSFVLGPGMLKQPLFTSCIHEGAVGKIETSQIF